MNKIEEAIDLLQHGIDDSFVQEGEIMQQAIDILSEPKTEPGEFEHVCCEPDCGAAACKYCGYCATEHSEDPVTDCPDPINRPERSRPKHRTTATCEIVRNLTDEIAQLKEAVETAKRQMCQLCEDWPDPTDCDRYPCWRITIVEQALKGE